jgi:molecular chaperone GrpE
VSDPKSEGNGGEESIASLNLDPELEAALAEAAAAVPDAHAKREVEVDVLEELVLEGAVQAPAELEAPRLQKEVTDANDRLLRLQADFENFRKRAQRERTEALQYGPQNLIKDLLSVVDNLERAIAHAQESEGGDLQSFLQGVEFVQREFLGVLGNHGVVEVEASGKTFDPALHEAMAQVPVADAAPNTVIDVLQKGYQLRDRLVRASRVVVTKTPDPGDGGKGEAAG